MKYYVLRSQTYIHSIRNKNDFVAGMEEIYRIVLHMCRKGDDTDCKELLLLTPYKICHSRLMPYVDGNIGYHQS